MRIRKHAEWIASFPPVRVETGRFRSPVSHRAKNGDAEQAQPLDDRLRQFRGLATRSIPSWCFFGARVIAISRLQSRFGPGSAHTPCPWVTSTHSDNWILETTGGK